MIIHQWIQINHHNSIIFKSKTFYFILPQFLKKIVEEFTLQQQLIEAQNIQWKNAIATLRGRTPQQKATNNNEVTKKYSLDIIVDNPNKSIISKITHLISVLLKKAIYFAFLIKNDINKPKEKALIGFNMSYLSSISRSLLTKLQQLIKFKSREIYIRKRLKSIILIVNLIKKKIKLNVFQCKLTGGHLQYIQTGILQSVFVMQQSLQRWKIIQITQCFVQRFKLVLILIFLIEYSCRNFYTQY